MNPLGATCEEQKHDLHTETDWNSFIRIPDSPHAKRPRNEMNDGTTPEVDEERPRKRAKTTNETEEAGIVPT
jgi:hypothetical protein